MNTDLNKKDTMNRPLERVVLTSGYVSQETARSIARSFDPLSKLPRLGRRLLLLKPGRATLHELTKTEFVDPKSNPVYLVEEVCYE